ncbi:ABC transporter permease [Candidatus Laterigemmans baculatus]|uniref:ABC transporter permease n=1 Tax=Candidatus Laterigemmans baculatus TaxID=2770505 RepID=UPI0013DC7B61|nr:FtsX-like permease family protein [Candidatus Laterigemmans baculatus]
MYRWLLCFRYLRTRYIALASIISVTLGVATLIVVNSVMAGFSAEMHERMHGLASDILLECHTVGGILDPEAHVEEIRELVGDQLVGTSVSVHVPAMMGIEHNGQLVTRQVNLVGIDARTYDTVSDFGKYLLHPENREHVAFELREAGYAPERQGFPESGWEYRRARAAYEKAIEAERQRIEAVMAANRRAAGQPLALPNAAGSAAGSTAVAGSAAGSSEAADSDAAAAGPGWSPLQATPEFASESGNPVEFDPAKETFPGIVLGIATCSTRVRSDGEEVEDYFYCRPGDDVRLMFPSASENTKVLDQRFTVVDLYESGMSEYDGTFAFVPLADLQEFRGMIDPESGRRSVTTIQLKLVEGADLNAVRDLLRRRFPPQQYAYQIQTWRDMQGPLLAAVQLETMILNILLFLIIAVAGFGILATFFMIVVEKTRDIGTLKALGASGRGVMSIFLSYGLLLGVVGSGVGLIGGLLFVRHINEVARLIEIVTGQEVFDPAIYYFSEIPTIVEPFTLVWVVTGAVLIATLASVLPAYRAARMHPVQALRYE